MTNERNDLLTAYKDSADRIYFTVRAANDDARLFVAYQRSADMALTMLEMASDGDLTFEVEEGRGVVFHLTRKGRAHVHALSGDVTEAPARATKH